MRRRLPHVLRVRDYTRLGRLDRRVRVRRARWCFVAVGWQVYDIYRNPLYLGLVGLAEFLPLLLLRAARRRDRGPDVAKARLHRARSPSTPRSRCCCSSSASTARTALAVPRALVRERRRPRVGNPAIRSMTPTLVPLELLPSALALRSTVSRRSWSWDLRSAGCSSRSGRRSSTRPAAVLMLDRGRRRRDDEAAGDRGGATARSAARASVAAGRAPLRPPDAGAARRDLARPRRGALRRRGRAAAASSPATCSTSGRSGWACCGARRRSARCWPGSCSRAGRCGGWRGGSS